MAPMSLRRRVTLSVIAVFTLLLIAGGFAVDATFVTTTNRSENTVLADHVQLARTLAAGQVSPAVLVDRVQTRSTQVSLVLANGDTFGTLDPADAARDSRVQWITFPNRAGTYAGARMALQVNGGFLTGVQRQLRDTLLIGAGVALLVVLLVVPVVVRSALVPLDRLGSLARRIADGRRGDRLGPTSNVTEIGKVAAAFDEMLDVLEGAEAKAIRSEASTRQFVADAAHELRTPISGISAAAYAAMDPSQDPQAREHLLLLLGREAHRAGRLVEDLLDLARLDVGIRLSRERIDLGSLTTARVDRLRLSHETITFEVSGTAPADVDPVRVGQIIDNVLNNACAAVGPTGSIRVRIETDRLGARVVITDDGPGIPPEDRERIFERLVRLDAARPSGDSGSGLGLPIARGLARSHGGDLVCAESERGARFVLTVPNL